MTIKTTNLYIYFFSILKDCEDWSYESTEKFVSLCNPETEMTALVDPYRVEDEGSVAIIVLYNGDEKNFSVNELLVKLKLASSDVFNLNDNHRDTETVIGK